MGAHKKWTGKCAYDPCDRDAAIAGLCKAHYRQQWEGRELTPIKKYKRFEQPTPDTKICTKCLTVKPVSEFYMRKTMGVLQSQCKRCQIKSAQAWKRANQAKNEAASRLVDPNVNTVAEDAQEIVDALLERFNG